jgi:hypothetical protein
VRGNWANLIDLFRIRFARRTTLAIDGVQAADGAKIARPGGDCAGARRVA